MLHTAIFYDRMSTIRPNMKYLILFLSLFLNLSADSYTNTMINIHAKVFPKILLSDTRIEEKLVDETIHIIILYSQEDYPIADRLRKQILNLYPRLKNYPLNITLKEYSSFDPSESASAYYELLGDKKSILNVNKIAQKNSVITFSYSSDYLEYGTLMSLYIGNQVSPYINTETLKQSHIVLDTIIYKIAKLR